MEFTEGVRFDSLHLSPEIIRAIENATLRCPPRSRQAASRL